MFPTNADAIRRLSEVFEPDAVAAIAPLLRPYLGFAQDRASSRIGATRIGGMPELPADLPWPIRETPMSVEEIVGLGGSTHAPHLRKHLAQPLPYVFIAQIDLAEAARIAGSEAPSLHGLLPDHGRLLVFCDLPVVPWRDGIESARVIWDISDPAALKKAETPAALRQIAETSLAELREEFEKHGLATDDLSHGYWGPERAMRLKAAVVLPEAGAPEAETDPVFVALMEDEDISDAYADFVSEHAHDTVSGIERHRIFGYPSPEQDDPRFAAVAIAEYGQARFWQWPNRPDMTEIVVKMKAWHVLLQCDLSDFHQDRLSEGTVYFLIRGDDLRARNFGRTVVVYQQT
jgi:uncharacterized protein YwqG